MQSDALLVHIEAVVCLQTFNLGITKVTATVLARSGSVGCCTPVLYVDPCTFVSLL